MGCVLKHTNHTHIPCKAGSATQETSVNDSYNWYNTSNQLAHAHIVYSSHYKVKKSHRTEDYYTQ